MLEKLRKQANHRIKTEVNQTYPPDERYKAHRPAETLNTALEPAIILIVLHVVIKHEPEDILHQG